MEARAPLAQLCGVSRRFASVVALSDVSIEVHAGELHAVVGENGAGKSTLGHVLTGTLQPDAGELRVNGAPVALASPRQARARGFVAVHQHSTLVPTLTVAENLILGSPWFRRPARAAARHRLAQEWAFGVATHADTPAGALSLGEQQQIEIARALWSGCRLLVLDEATAMQTPAQAALLMATLRRLADGGMAVVTITHKLDEAVQADRVTVLRRGVVVGSLSPASLRQNAAALQAQLVALMFADAPPPPARSLRPALGAAMLQVRNLSQRASGQPALENIGFDVAAGEVFGIAGIDGNGQAALARLLAGEATPQAGTVRFDGRALRGGVAALRRAGLRHISDDRLGEETIGSFAVAINLVLKRIGAPPFWSWGLQRRAALDRHARDMMQRFDIRAPGPWAPVAQLSGGNVQKLILARELDDAARLVICNKPTNGLDRAAALAVQARLREKAARGVAIVVISPDLDELAALCDRIGVLRDGKLVGIAAGPPFDIPAIGRMMVA